MAYLYKNVIVVLQDGTQLTGVLKENGDGTYSVGASQSTGGSTQVQKFSASDVQSVREV